MHVRPPRERPSPSPAALSRRRSAFETHGALRGAPAACWWVRHKVESTLTMLQSTRSCVSASAMTACRTVSHVPAADQRQYRSFFHLSKRSGQVTPWDAGTDAEQDPVDHRRWSHQRPRIHRTLAGTAHRTEPSGSGPVVQPVAFGPGRSTRIGPRARDKMGLTASGWDFRRLPHSRNEMPRPSNDRLTHQHPQPFPSNKQRRQLQTQLLPASTPTIFLVVERLLLVDRALSRSTLLPPDSVAASPPCRPIRQKPPDN